MGGGCAAGHRPAIADHSLEVAAWLAVPAPEATTAADVLMPQWGGCVAGCRGSPEGHHSLVVAAWVAKPTLGGHHSKVGQNRPNTAPKWPKTASHTLVALAYRFESTFNDK